MAVAWNPAPGATKYVLYRNGVVLATVTAGSYVGEISLMDDAPASARVTALESVKALRIQRDRFEQFVEESNQIVPLAARAIAEANARELGELVDRSQKFAETLLGNQTREV